MISTCGESTFILLLGLCLEHSKATIRQTLRAGVVTAVAVMLFLALVSATRDAMRYEYQTKPAALKAQGVK